MKTKAHKPVAKIRHPKPPKFIWADFADRQWAFYTSRRDQRSNRPDLKPIRLKVEVDEVELNTTSTCPHCGCQTNSPFPWNSGKQIHDVDACRKQIQPKNRQKRKSK